MSVEIEDDLGGETPTHTPTPTRRPTPTRDPDLLDERVRRHERVVFLGEFLDQLFVLVQLLQRFLVHARDSVGCRKDRGDKHDY